MHEMQLAAVTTAQEAVEHRRAAHLAGDGAFAGNADDGDGAWLQKAIQSNTRGPAGVHGFPVSTARTRSTMLVANALISSSGKCEVGWGTTIGWKPRMPQVSAWYAASRTMISLITAALGTPAFSSLHEASTLLTVQA